MNDNKNDNVSMEVYYKIIVTLENSVTLTMFVSRDQDIQAIFNLITSSDPIDDSQVDWDEIAVYQVRDGDWVPYSFTSSI